MNTTQGTQPIRTGRRLLILLCLLLGLLWPALTVQAAVIAGVSGSANISGSSTVTIRWQVTYAAALPPGTLVRGVLGEIFVPNGPVLGTLPDIGPVPATKTGNGAVAILQEQARIPQSVVIRALDLGYTQIGIRRQFQTSAQGPAPQQGLASIRITSSGLGALTINRIELRFADDSRSTVVPEGSRLTARADVRYSGKGVLQGVWEVASPPSTLGDPVFQQVKLVRLPLLGGQKTTLTIPELPTRISGLHLLRFRVTQPEGLLDTPVIRYFVTRGDTRQRPVIRILSPAPLTQLDAHTRFGWQPVPGAEGYQIEFFEARNAPWADDLRLEEVNARRLLEGGAPLRRTAGVMLPGDLSSVTLSALTRNHLQPGQRYLWRVIAFDKQGRRMAESTLRPVRVP